MVTTRSYDRCGVKCDANIGNWKRRRNLMQSCFPGCFDPVAFLEKPFVRHKDESNYVLWLVFLLKHVNEVKDGTGRLLFHYGQPYDRYYLIQDTHFWYQEMEFELRHRSRRARRLSRRHSTEVIPLPHRDRRSYHGSTPDAYGFYNFLSPFGGPMPPVLAYCSALFCNGTEAQSMVFGRIPEVTISVFSYGSFLRVVGSGPVKRLSFSLSIEECDGHGVLMYVPRAKIKKWLDYGTLLFDDWLEADLTLALVAVARLCKIH